MRSPLRRWTVPVVAVLVLGAVTVVSVLLWQWIDRLTLTDSLVEKKASAHLDVLKLAASIAVGGGGLFALYLAARRQRTQELELEERKRELAQRDKVQVHAEQVAEDSRQRAERISDATERDAAARRVTELYAMAAEQLGSEKAPVRLAGLYALERLAQDNTHQRKTVIDLICGYLRMPYEPPGPLPYRLEMDDFDQNSEHVERTRKERSERAQERQVRITAQRILATHLRPSVGKPVQVPNNPEYWAGNFELDLTGATFINVNMKGCTFASAQFDDARFIGETSFLGATFSSNTSFSNAAFFDRVAFDFVTFVDIRELLSVAFDGAAFFGDASFRDANFDGSTSFSRAKFQRSSTFSDATFIGEHSFAGGANFMDTVFVGDTYFDNVKLNGGASFRKAEFVSRASFKSSVFMHGANFDQAKFSGVTEFDLTDPAQLEGLDTAWVQVDEMGSKSTWPSGWALDSASTKRKNEKGELFRLIKVSTR